MKVSFQTPTHNFIADFNDSICAKKILDDLPLDSSISIGQDRICFKLKAPVSPGGQAPVRKVKAGDVVYWPDIGYLCIFLGSMEIASEKNASLELIPVGTVEGGLDDFDSIAAGDSIRVVAMGGEEKKISADSVPDPNRKLSQDEIDVLVQQLLAQKKKEQEQQNKGR